jgi:hypothetical protein
MCDQEDPADGSKVDAIRQRLTTELVTLISFRRTLWLYLK